MPSRALKLILALLLAVPALPLAASESPLSTVGVAKVDLTPDYPVWLHLRASRSAPTDVILQRVHAKAIAIGSDAENPAVLITVDTLKINDRMRGELVDRLTRKTKVRPETLSICASHTHAAPVVAGDPPGMAAAHLQPKDIALIERYTRDLLDRLEQVALAALADRKPSRLSWGSGAVGWARNRRPLWAFRPVDHSLPVLRVDGADGTLRAILTSYACHATAFGSINQIHGDWAGCAQEYLEKELPGVIALVAIGCGGDSNPLPRGTWNHAVQYGHELGAEAKRVAQGTLKPITRRLECRLREFTLPLDPAPTRAEFEVRARDENKVVAYHAGAQLAKLDRGERLLTDVPYLVQTWAFGRDLAMVFLAGEIVVDYSLRLKRELDSERLWVNSYANAVPCYIPSERVLREGGYEAEFALFYGSRFPSRIAAGVEDRIIGAVHSSLPEHFRTK